ncbi:MAG: BamA/TamA family outer membrane protein [Saprospiraceae bacterium]|nr:BamA/TamA family outer membrane protein [Saprospiraceae bacterium]
MAQPTVDNPVQIKIEPVNPELPPGSESAVKIIFRVPKYMWLGARPEEARTPPGTRIKVQPHPAFTFEEPRFPEPSVEGVPAHVGTTKVYMGEISVIVPFRVSENAVPGKYEIKILLTYTPGFNAGKLKTHVDEPYAALVTIDPEAARPGGLPAPAKDTVPSDFVVSPKPINSVKPIFFPYEDGTRFSRIMHGIFLDPPGHNKRLRQVTYPFVNATEALGTSLGLGVGLLNTTPEGALTGVMTLLGFNNSFVGPVFGLDLVTCPAAYHNLRFNVRVSTEDFEQIQAKYENFTLGDDDRWGLQFEGTAFRDSRFRLFGLGPNTTKKDGAVYQHEQLSTILDFYSLHFEKFRIGLGYTFKEVNVKEGDQTILDEEGVPSAVNEDRFQDLPGIEGATIMGGRFNIIYDGRNQEFNPSRGFFGQLTAEYNSILDDKGVDMEDNYTSLRLDLRKYWSSTDQKFIALLRNQWVINGSREIPFFEQARMGGPTSIRAFPAGRFTGQNLLFLSAEFRYSLLKFKILNFPMVLQLGVFLDAGQVFENFDFEGTFNKSPGMSIRVINYPNAGYILNIAHSRAGINVSGGISLPF